MGAGDEQSSSGKEARWGGVAGCTPEVHAAAAGCVGARRAGSAGGQHGRRVPRGERRRVRGRAAVEGGAAA